MTTTDFENNAGSSVEPKPGTTNGGSTAIRLERIEQRINEVKESAINAVLEAKGAALEAHQAAKVTQMTSDELTALHKGGTLVAIATAQDLKEVKISLLGGKESPIPNDIGMIGRINEKLDDIYKIQETKRYEEKQDKKDHENLSWTKKAVYISLFILIIAFLSLFFGILFRAHIGSILY